MKNFISLLLLFSLIGYSRLSAAPDQTSCAADAGPDKTLTCANPFAIIGTPAVTGNTYSWSPAGGLSNASIAQPTAGTPNIYTLTVTNTATGCTATDAVTVTYDCSPTFADAGPDKILTCGDTGVVIGTPAVPGYYYSWFPASGVNSPTSAQPMAIIPNTYILAVTKASTGSMKTDTVIVTQNGIQPIANAGIDTTISEGQTVLLRATGGTSYHWSNGKNTDTITVQPLITTDYIVTVTNAQNCSSKDTVSVRIMVTGVKNNSNINLFEVSPSPANSKLNINIERNTSNDLQIFLMDSQGKKYYSENFTKDKIIHKTLDISQYAKGIYFIYLVENNSISYKKIMIE